MTTRRRALLLTGSMLVMGLGVGYAGGYWLGMQGRAPAQLPQAADETLDGAITGPTQAVEGTTIEVQVSASAGSVQVSLGGPGNTYSIPVPSNGRVQIPVPPGVGSAIAVSVGTGLKRRFLVVEVISPDP